MTHDPDKRLAELLSKDAPPARDALFRVQVLARLEREKYRRRLAAMIACAVVFAAVAAVGASVGGTTREGAAALLVGVALTVAYFVAAPTLAQLLARFR
jgi:hypothetical protein